MNQQIQRIKELKKENDICIIAHHYAPAETHEVADTLGDSRDFFSSVVKGCKEKNILVLAPTFLRSLRLPICLTKMFLYPAEVQHARLQWTT